MGSNVKSGPLSADFRLAPQQLTAAILNIYGKSRAVKTEDKIE
jgi:hypothetical protein